MATTIVPFSNSEQRSQSPIDYETSDELEKFRETLKKTLSSNSLYQQKKSYAELKNRATALEGTDSSCAVIIAIAMLPFSLLVASYFK